MVLRLVRGCAVLSAALTTFAVPARAEELTPGDTDFALPGIARVGVAAPTGRRLSAAVTAGYGMFESQNEGDGAHHRLSGSGAVAITPIAPVALALRFDERYDLHPDDGMGSHGSAVGDPRFLARVGAAVAAFRVGAELGAWFPGKNAPSIAFDATTVDARALGAWVAPSGLTIGVAAGFRLDNSQHAVNHPERLRFGDRLSLGLSDFNAVLAGVGVAIPFGKTEVLGELSSDLLVGNGAPKVTDSPLRITAGVRQPLSSLFALELRAEASPSGRPTLTATSPLVPIEPRFSVLLGLRFTLPFDREMKAVAPPPAAPPPAPRPALPTTSTLVVHVTAEDGTAVGDAKVDLRLGDFTSPPEGGADGNYRFSGVPAGTATLSVTADGFTAVEEQIPVGSAPVEVHLVRATPSGQLRGLVRSFGGKGLKASVHVAPIDKETTTDAGGAFTIDVPPGDYQVVIAAPHFKSQHRKIHIDENGVTILNAELFEAK